MIRFFEICCLLGILCPFVFGEHFSMDVFANFGKESVNGVKLHKAVNLLKSGRCKHVYVDMGTNIGIQIRKLYEPKYFPLSKIVNEFYTYFGNSTEELKNVCSFGFEASPSHTKRLDEVEEAYNKAGFPVVIFTETAVTTETGEVSFYVDKFSRQQRHEWGASMASWNPKMDEKTKITVGALNMADFLHMMLSVLNHVSDPDTIAKRKMMAKMDIETAEFSVVPNLLYAGVFCKFNFIYMEWHADLLMYAKRYKKEQLEATILHTYPYSLNFELEQIKECRDNLKLVWMDDESYGSGEDKFPLPS